MSTTIQAYEIIRLLPEETKNEITGIGSVTRRNCFRLGRVTNQIIEQISENPAKYANLSVMAVYVAVAILDNEEHSARTIRDYSDICKLYKPEDELQYEQLPFAHFRYAASFNGRRYEILDYALKQCMEYGKPPSVAELEAYFNPQPEQPEVFFSDDTSAPQFENAEPVGEHPAMGLVDAVSIIDNYLKKLPDGVSEIARGLLKQILDYLQEYIDNKEKV